MRSFKVDIADPVSLPGPKDGYYYICVVQTEHVAASTQVCDTPLQAMHEAMKYYPERRWKKRVFELYIPKEEDHED